MTIKNQIEAVLYRRWKIFHRSLCGYITILIISLIVGYISLVLPKILTISAPLKLGFNAVHSKGMSFGLITNNQTTVDLTEINDFIHYTAKKETGRNIKQFNFTSYDEIQNFVLAEQSKDTNTINMVYAYGFENGTQIHINNDGSVDATIHGIYLYNYSYGYENKAFSSITFRRMLWKYFMNDKDADILITTANSNNFVDSSEITRYSIPYTPTISLIFFSIYFVAQILEDISTPKRSYMLACGLNLFAYWIGNFIFDFIIYLIYALLIFIPHAACSYEPFTSKNDLMIYMLFFAGPSTIFISYLFSLVIKLNKSVGSTVYLFFLMIPFLITLLLDMMLSASLESEAYAWINGLLPVTFIYRLTSVILNYEYKNFGDAWKNKMLLPYVLMPLIDLILYPLIIYLFEILKEILTQRYTKDQYVNHVDKFKERKSKQRVTEEVILMEEAVRNANSHDFAICIKNVSKLFMDTRKNPIYAVNDVSLGIERGKVFGFLGANGAGKTTLLKMIIGTESLSNGTIEVNGVDIRNKKESLNKHDLTVCPQFDDHLTPEMTGYEQLIFYAKLFNLDNKEKTVKKLIKKVGLSEHAHQKICKMSGGNQRKVCVALPFLSGSSIILLDEPTSSLDPNARRNIHNMIKEYRNTKTFMLCTHLLDEAESLSDQISIMLNGCIYTVGTPQKLSSKFGTEFKINIQLQSPQKSSSVKDFIENELPMAQLSVSRPLSLIYTVPSQISGSNNDNNENEGNQDVNGPTLLELFKIMQNAIGNEEIGVEYFTCSSSNLEKVFLEIVHLSEINNGEDENSNSRSDDFEEEQQNNPIV
ncbi:ABC transporter family protein [Tritrichomonas foetus]|uniref:ABC transporter family protein n=1 Tax=Tritrichomonas foetus TaxID=1144522 RepID=A0A1J4JJV7_9EUKA|nr:ABC transporter family protein [Tritrichomonas foetus]|eukprot:OHS99440.1 ABC transporter family protein [Tritrichomonas foetus]